MVEFALTAPLFVLIVFGIIELGILFAVYIGLTNSAREATRAAAVYRYPGATPISTDLTAVNDVDTARLAFFTSILTSTMNPIISPADVVVAVDYVPAPGDTYTQPAGVLKPVNTSNLLRSGDTISATLQYSHQLFFGILGDRKITFTASSAARLEPGGAE